MGEARGSPSIHRRGGADAIHALFAVPALLLYGAGLAVRYVGLARSEATSPAVIALSAVGVALLWAAAWYGGELVCRYGIGLADPAAARAQRTVPAREDVRQGR